MEQLPKIVAQRLQAVSRTETHPDANLLSAFAEKSLLPREQAQILEHLATCVECREVVAHAQPEEVLQSIAVAAAAPMAVRRSWFSGAAVRWTALAACVVVVGAAVISRTQFKVYAPAASDSKPAVVAKTESLPQPPPNAPAEDKEANHEASGRLKAASSIPAKRDFDRLSELDKQSAANSRESSTVAKGSFRERRQAEESVNGLVVANNAPSSPTDTVTTMGRAAAAPVVAQQQEDAKSNKKEFSADKAMRDPAGTNEIAQAQAVSAPPPPPPPAAAAKPTTVLADSGAKRDESEGLRSAYKAKDGYVGGAIGSLAGLPIIPTWQLSSEGKLIKSLDHGQNWQPVSVADNAVFRALCVTGREIWVGGNQGSLFYSPDMGQQWEQVKPMAKGQTLTADITAIEFKDSNHGKVTTADHQTWITNDDGHSWKVETR